MHINSFQYVSDFPRRVVAECLLMTQSGHRRLVEKTLISVLVVLAGASKIRVLIIHLRRGDGGVERIPTTVAKITLADVES